MKIKKEKNFETDKKIYKLDINNCYNYSYNHIATEERQDINIKKKEIFLQNFNLIIDLDRMEKIETKSKETYLVFSFFNI